MSLPFVTADLPGSGGRIKASPEDFRVEEQPAYLPQGSGPHLWLLAEKRGRTTRELARELAAALSVPEREVGYAGQKDKAAVTVQWLSFPVARDPDPAALAGEGWRVLRASRHQNKLRLGHARGNRFEVAVRGGDAGRARDAAGALAARGFANFFGAQRFGAEGRNAAVGKALLTGRLDEPGARQAARDRFLRRLCISAWQSELFNRWLAERMAEGLFDRALAGDVMKKLATGGVFVCQDPEADGPRVAAFEISPAGPIFGHKMREAEGAAREREERLLRESGVGPADLRRGGGEAEGTRRPGRLAVSVEIEPLPDGYWARFELPSGSYATVVVGELTKAGAALPESDD
ncbi:MAG: tRNA pseudouridine(13) synthase TruD [Deltaproteobacteria bacterium]|nr:tRNA pseudouridine(13) synthase TruD [Deltaproteobacteria bacterium]